MNILEIIKGIAIAAAVVVLFCFIGWGIYKLNAGREP